MNHLHMHVGYYYGDASCYPPPSTIHVDCVTVSTLPVKSAIDDHIQQLFDALLSSLRRSISANLQVRDGGRGTYKHVYKLHGRVQAHPGSRISG